MNYFKQLEQIITVEQIIYIYSSLIDCSIIYDIFSTQSSNNT